MKEVLPAKGFERVGPHNERITLLRLMMRWGQISGHTTQTLRNFIAAKSLFSIEYKLKIHICNCAITFPLFWCLLLLSLLSLLPLPRKCHVPLLPPFVLACLNPLALCFQILESELYICCRCYKVYFSIKRITIFLESVCCT